MHLLANVLIDGLAYGMVLFVIAVGLSVTLGVMRFVNLSHGAFAMIGGYLAASLIRDAGWSFWIAAPAAILATGIVGAALEIAVLHRLYRRTELSQVLFTIGLTFFIIATTNALAGPQVQLIPLPPSLAGSIDLGFRTLPTQRLLVIVAGAAIAALLALGVTRSRFGIWLRATVDHPDTSAALGIPTRLVQCVSFSVGAALAAMGGILGAELMPLEPFYALKYLVLVLVVVAVGGMGSLLGALVAGLALGTIDTASKYLASSWGTLFFFLAMTLLLAWRPHGLLDRSRA